jgi:hypothetical protein
MTVAWTWRAPAGSIRRTDLYDLTAWLRAVGKDDVPCMMIETGGTP